MKAYYKKYVLDFKNPSGTSRGIITQKETWFLFIVDENYKTGIGECGLLKTLSVDDRPDYEEKLQWVCKNILLGKDEIYNSLTEFPSIQFGVEMAFASYYANNSFILFPSLFTQGKDSIYINGLVWMGTKEFMKAQIQEKIEQNFSCIKLKIGAISFNEELYLLNFIRENFSEKQLEIRVDANGAFSYNNALEKLIQLSEFNIHSIEQPIACKQYLEMQSLCKNSPIPIALDEELIGIYTIEEKTTLLQKINPKYIILKPSLIGGFKGTLEWINIANNLNIGWWITSALESNIGLNAIAQFTYTLKNNMPQGLGTGSLYTNNIDSPLQIKNAQLQYNNYLNWNVSNLKISSKNHKFVNNNL